MRPTLRGLIVLICTPAVATIAFTAPAQAVPVKPGPSAPHHHKTARLCSKEVPGRAACFAIKQTDTIEPPPFQNHAVTPNATPAGYSPANLQSAYQLDASRGTGATVAVVDAYDDPSAESDLATYRSQYGLPACTTANGCFRKVNQNGAASPLPAANTGWAGEISLDLDMVSAICPNCKIILVESNDPTLTSLGTGVNTAVALGAKFVSNSYGGPESAAVTVYDTTYFNHPGVVITASSGDLDYDGGSYPATSKYVTATGGTTLTAAANARGWSETVWNTTSYTQGAGSGCSQYITKPSFQSGLTTGCARRAEADVSAVADPNTGLAVYQSYGGSGWAVYGGTSAAAPIIASVYALAGTPRASDTPNAYPYAHPGNLFDVTSGSNGTCGAPLCTAGPGWDGPTGLGTPNGLAAFTATTGIPNTVTVTNPGNRTGVVGTATSLQISASDSGGATLTYSAQGLPPGLSINPSTGLITGTPSAPGTFTVTVTATDSTGASGSATFTWSISPAPTRCASPGQKLSNPGFESGNTIWSTTSGVIGQWSTSGEPPHAGTWDAWLDGYGQTHTDTISQSVTIPAGCTASTVSFYLHIDTAELLATQHDTLTVKLGTTTIATFSNLNKASGYVLKTYSISAFAGRTVTLTFTGTEDPTLQTSFVLDDIAVTAS